MATQQDFQLPSLSQLVSGAGMARQATGDLDAADPAISIAVKKQVPVAAAFASGSGVGMAWDAPKKQAPPAAAFASGRGVGMAWH